jgi:hypothetical protein
MRFLAGHSTDTEWLAAEDERRATGDRQFFRDKAAERGLRDRVSAEIESLLAVEAASRETAIDLLQIDVKD